MVKLRFLLLLLGAWPAMGLAQPDVHCPWFTTGSAARVLGGEVKVTTHVVDSRDGSCEFTRTLASSAQVIEILVGKSDTHPCPESSQRLKALGNEAAQCTRDGQQGQRQDIIAGRVRDVFFVVSLSSGPPSLPKPEAMAGPDSNGASPLERVAEQVAGNLF